VPQVPDVASTAEKYRPLGKGLLKSSGVEAAGIGHIRNTDSESGERGHLAGPDSGVACVSVIRKVHECDGCGSPEHLAERVSSQLPERGRQRSVVVQR
jgi:hypothetical protein